MSDGAGWVVKEVIADQVEMRETDGGYWRTDVHARATAIMVQTPEVGACREMRIAASASAGFDEDTCADLAVKDAVVSAMARARGMAAGYILAMNGPEEPTPEAAPTPVTQEIIVNGQAVAVPRDPNYHVLGVAQRAIEMARY